ncbi:MAG: hypothetical protein ACYDHM_14770 [Acidiferrobacterales bacterium]
MALQMHRGVSAPAPAGHVHTVNSTHEGARLGYRLGQATLCGVRGHAELDRSQQYERKPSEYGKAVQARFPKDGEHLAHC